MAKIIALWRKLPYTAMSYDVRIMFSLSWPALYWYSSGSKISRAAKFRQPYYVLEIFLRARDNLMLNTTIRKSINSCWWCILYARSLLFYLFSFFFFLFLLYIGINTCAPVNVAISKTMFAFKFNWAYATPSARTNLPSASVLFISTVLQQIK